MGPDTPHLGGPALDGSFGITRAAPSTPAQARDASARTIDAALDRWVADALGPVGIVLAVMYVLSVVSRAADPAIAATTPPTAAVLVLTFLGMGVLVLHRPLPGSLAHPLLVGALGLIMVEALIRGPAIAATDLPWAIIGSGAVALRPRWYAAALAMVIVPFALVVTVVPASPWAATTATYRLDFVMASLLASVVFIGRRRALVRLEITKAELRDAAHEDPLTSLPNRRGLAAAAEPIREHARRTGEIVQVASVDLDGFKVVNDADGHAVGDAVLRVVAAAIRTSIRATDVVARVGGDEFAIVAPGLAETRALDARLEEAVRRATAAAGHEVGVSIGWCPIEPQDRRPILELVDEADRVMYALRHRRRATAAELPEHALEVARVA